MWASGAVLAPPIDCPGYDMDWNGMERSAATKWGVPPTTLQIRKKARFKSVTRPGPPQSSHRMRRRFLVTALLS